MKPSERRQFFALLKKDNKKPTTELVYNSTFELLISVILSAQATDISVNKATKALFEAANTPEKIEALEAGGLKTYIKTIGLFNTKADNIIKTCRLLIKKHHSKVPNTRKALEGLPGVGRKTANVVLNTAFGQPTIAVDTHIFRVSNRTGLAKGNTPIAVEKGLLKNVPDEYKLDAHHWLILHGRYTCTARKPNCNTCIVSMLCKFKDKNSMPT